LRGIFTVVFLRGDSTQANRLTNENSNTFRLHFLHHLRAVALDLRALMSSLSAIAWLVNP
jgi:hypothetical protein